MTVTIKTSKKTQLKSWRGGSQGFFRFLDDVQPRILTASGRWEPYVPDDRARAEIAEALDSGCGTVVFCWPRRHGKTLAAGMVILWKFLTWPNQAVALVANSERQAVDTCFKIVRSALERTPYTAKMIQSGAIKVLKESITYSAAGSTITGYAANPAALYGLKLSVAQVSELHAARDPEVFNVLAGSTMDTEGGLVLVDSSVGSKSSPLWVLWQAWKQKASDIHVSYLSYSSLAKALEGLPPWLSADKLKLLNKTMLPALFAQQHLNVWQSGTNSLFPPVVLKRIRDDYPLDVSAVAGDAPRVVGGGLDRAYGFSIHGDRTVTTCVLKVLQKEEPHFYVLDSEAVRFSSAAGIRRNFDRYATEFGMIRCAIESYNSQDIASWAADQAFDHEVIHATAERQAGAFDALYNAAADARLHVHPKFTKLLDEMSDFEYRLEQAGSKGMMPKFEAAKGSKDDFVYSLAWAVYALRGEELDPYEVPGIFCQSDLRVANLCVLNGGSLVPHCSEECGSFKAVERLYDRYTNNGQVTHLPLEEFFPRKVTNTGPHVIPR